MTPSEEMLRAVEKAISPPILAMLGRFGVEKIIKVAFDAADLVPHSDVQAALDMYTLQANKTAEALRERDEALRTLAALREALENAEREMKIAYAYVVPAMQPSIYKGLTDAIALASAALTDTAVAAAQYQRVPEVAGDPDMPNLELCSFNYLADAIRRRGATVTPAPHGGDFAAAAPKAAEPKDTGSPGFPDYGDVDHD